MFVAWNRLNVLECTAILLVVQMQTSVCAKALIFFCAGFVLETFNP